MSCNSPDPPAFCSDSSPELKLYQAFIFSVPVFFTFILLVLFYLFYLRRRRANWASLRMRVSYQAREEMPRVLERGLKNEVRDMLPVLVFKENFLIRESQCSVCLGDYKTDDRLKRIPPCGHTFHVECIDNWLAKNITCPLCRASLIPTPKAALVIADPERSQHALEDQDNEDHHYPSRPEESSSAVQCDAGSDMGDGIYLCSIVREECSHDAECRSVSEVGTHGAV